MANWITEMNQFKCSKCFSVKERSHFYNNSNKKNGLESQCKECVLKRKANKYKASSNVKKKNKYLRSLKKTKVVDLDQCTFHHIMISKCHNHEIQSLKQLVERILVR